LLKNENRTNRCRKDQDEEIRNQGSLGVLCVVVDVCPAARRILKRIFEERLLCRSRKEEENKTALIRALVTTIMLEGEEDDDDDETRRRSGCFSFFQFFSLFFF
jgi:hypothetical protein